MSEQERAALILRIARQFMRAGWARGWSDAIRIAREQVQGATQGR